MGAEGSMPPKNPEEHFQDYLDSGIISLIVPIGFAALYQSAQSVPYVSLGVWSKIPFLLLSAGLLFMFLTGLVFSTLRGGLFGGIGYLIGNYGVNQIFEEPIAALLITGLGAVVAYAGTSSRTRIAFIDDTNQLLQELEL